MIPLALLLSIAVDHPAIRAERLADRLGGPTYAGRERAGKELVALGRAALPVLRRGQTHRDPEIAERTRSVKERLARAPSLTPRERELVELVRQGLRNRDIASQLGVTEGTVKVYLHAIFDKLGVDNRTELAMRAPELLGG